MPQLPQPQSVATSVSKRAMELFLQAYGAVAHRTDRMFMKLIAAEWLAGIIFGLVVSPRVWVGDESFISPHLIAAIVLGAAIAFLPIWMAWKRPGQVATRHVIAFAQMSFSGLLIHLTGGRIETHFHVFGSLAFLSFYRDPWVLVTA
ncbi:MAG TPA: GGDEF-domain containing protein, partial [Terriglobales bacterium]